MRISDWSSDVCSSYLVEDVEDAARSGLTVERRQRDRIDAGKRHERQEAEDDQRADREPDAVLEFGRLTELRKVQVGSKLVGARGHGCFPRIVRTAPPATRRLCAFDGREAQGERRSLKPPPFSGRAGEIGRANV